MKSILIFTNRARARADIIEVSVQLVSILIKYVHGLYAAHVYAMENSRVMGFIFAIEMIQQINNTNIRVRAAPDATSRRWR